jgi:hypothetical protein
MAVRTARAVQLAVGTPSASKLRGLSLLLRLLQRLPLATPLLLRQLLLSVQPRLFLLLPAPHHPHTPR